MTRANNKLHDIGIHPEAALHRSAVFGLCQLILLVCAMVIGSCAEIVTPPVKKVEETTKLQDFFWPQKAGSFAYRITDGAGQLLSTHHISIPDSAERFQEFTVTETDGANSYSLQSRASGIELAMSGFTSNTLFSLPAGMQIAADLAETPVETFDVYALITLTSKRILASTPAGLFASDDDAVNWTKIAPLASMTMFAQDSTIPTPTVYSSNGSALWFSVDNGVNWQPVANATTLTQPLTAIAVDADGALYVSNADGIFKRSAGGVNFDKLGAACPPGVTAFTVIAGSKRFVIAGTSTELYRFIDNKWELVQSGYAEPVRTLVSGKPNLAYLTVGQDVIGSLDAQSNNWIGSTVTGESGKYFISLAVNMATGNGYVVDNFGAVLAITPPPAGGGPGRSTFLKRQNVATRCIALSPSGKVLVGTFSGIWWVENGKAPVTIGPFIPHPERVWARLKLLTKAAGFAVGATWDAGYIDDGVQKPVKLTGRIIDRFDNYVIGTDTLGETLAIRYASEASDSTVSSTLPFYWIAYLTRGTGPVTVDQISTSTNTTTRRALLSR